MNNKMFRIMHWDTFDNESFEVGRAETLAAAETFVLERYGSRIRPTGADKVDIVDTRGNIVRQFSVG